VGGADHEQRVPALSRRTRAACSSRYPKIIFPADVIASRDVPAAVSNHPSCEAAAVRLCEVASARALSDSPSSWRNHAPRWCRVTDQFRSWTRRSRRQAPPPPTPPPPPPPPRRTIPTTFISNTPQPPCSTPSGMNPVESASTRNAATAPDRQPKGELRQARALAEIVDIHGVCGSGLRGPGHVPGGSA